MKKSITERLKNYVALHNPLGLCGSEINLLNKNNGNHLIYKIQKDDRVYILRMMNPENCGVYEQIAIGEEYEVLKALEHTNLVPKVYYLDIDASPALLIQEFVDDAICFKNLRPFSKEHLVDAAQAIAYLNCQNITPKKFPFMNKYAGKSMSQKSIVWYCGLLDALRLKTRGDVLKWVLRIFPLAIKSANILTKNHHQISASQYTFHFDGAHIDNAYWRKNRTMFLDWQKVSWRKDPAFSLVKFAVSAHAEEGVVSKEFFEILLDAYSQERPIANFIPIARMSLMEHQVSDLILTLLDYTKRKETKKIDEVTNVACRYKELKKIIAKYE
jgi:hypothetical protein